MVQFGFIRSDLVCFDSFRVGFEFGSVWFSSFQFGLTQFVLISVRFWFVLVRFKFGLFSLPWFGLVQFGSVRFLLVHFGLF